MIVDTSALLATILPEWPAEQRRRLRRLLVRVTEREPVESSGLMPYEAGHVLFTKSARGTPVPVAARNLGRLLGFVALAQANSTDHVRTGILARGSKIGFYDASFLYHALARDAALVTADHGMAKHARALGLTAYWVPAQLDLLEQRYPVSTA